MANQKLTDRNLQSVSLPTDIAHIVRSNTSYKQSVATLVDDKISLLNDRVTEVDNKVVASSSGFQGVLAIADTPSVDGYYFASESGTYINAGSLIVDLENTITYITVSGNQTVFEKIEIQVSSLGYKVVNNLGTLDALISLGLGGNWLVLGDIVLDSNKTIPSGVTLHFNGGSIDLNGFSLIGNLTSIEANAQQIFIGNASYLGLWIIDNAYPEWFGAIGDGLTDDSQSLFNCHSFANNAKCDVVYSGNDYLIGAVRGILVNTSVDFNNSKLIIDQSNSGAEVFIVESDYTWTPLTLSSFEAIKSEFKRNANYIPSLNDIVDQNKLVKIIYEVDGTLTSDNATRQSIEETFVHVQNGKIIGNIIENVNTFTDAEYRSIDNGVKLENAKVYLINNNQTLFFHTFSVTRDNVELSNIIIDREFVANSKRKSVININRCFNTTIDKIYSYNPEMTIIPYNSDGESFEGYIFQIRSCVNTFINNFNTTTRHYNAFNELIERATWGDMAGYSFKNLYISNSSLSRLDVHEQANGITVRDSFIDWVQVVGTGKMLMDNVELSGQYNNGAIAMYNSVATKLNGCWYGDIVLKDCTYKPLVSQTDYFLVDTKIVASHGYADFTPFQSLIIKNLTIDLSNIDTVDNTSRLMIIDEYSNDAIRGIVANMPNKIIIDGINYIGTNPCFVPELFQFSEVASTMTNQDGNSDYHFKNIEYKSVGTNLDIADSDVFRNLTLSNSNGDVNLYFEYCKIPVLSTSLTSGNSLIRVSDSVINSLVTERNSVITNSRLLIKDCEIILKSYNETFIPLVMKPSYAKDVNISGCFIHPYEISVGGGTSVSSFFSNIDAYKYTSSSYTNLDIVEPADLANVKGHIKRLDYDNDSFSITWNPSSISTGGSATQAITVNNTSLGDFVVVSADYDLQGCYAGGYVSASNTVQIVVINNTGSAVDLGSGEWNVKVIKI